MDTFPNALEKGHWEVADLCLVIGMLCVATKSPQGAILNLVPTAESVNAPVGISRAQRR